MPPAAVTPAHRHGAAGAAVVKGRGVEWAVRAVLGIGRRSSGLLPDDSGADEAALAAQGIEAAHGTGVSDLGGLTEEVFEWLRS